MKLAFLGPAPPFRGGIVTYYGLLARALEQAGHQVYWASFAAQYPGFLFPGTTQEGETAPWLDHPNTPRFVPWSPWSWWRAARDIEAAGVEAVVIKYWLPFFAPGFWGVTRRLRAKGVRVVYLLDNVIPHEKYPLGQFLTRKALGTGHGFIAQSGQVRADLFSVLPDTDPQAVRDVPHPVYDFGAPGRPRKTRQEARRDLGLDPDRRVVLFFGFIKPYKGVVHLIDAAGPLRAEFGDELQVLIVGDIYGGRQPYLDRIAASAGKDIVTLVEGFVPDETVEDYFVAADLVVLPYVSATQSGIVQIAYHYDRPVVTTRVGGLPEVVREGETGFLVPPEDSGALADAITRFFREDKADEFAAAVAREKKKYSWESMVEAIVELAQGPKR
ncbi:glycosyltransferase [bacterium]|nr:glycosyltransferase [bacterium]PIV80295.1 MAG: glycosyl transferase [bacterium CG17_big_fil_post_rev_8_21_14_2_50_64_8]PJA73973.1 MAG: glycosyl transferase [bacterium CG_4_9_14_3_um_filter_65_15]